MCLFRTLYLLLLAVAFHECSSLMTTTPRRISNSPWLTTARSTSSLQARMSDRDEEAMSRARNDARTDVRNFLTQRAYQSFMYLCDSVRDPHSIKWMENFLQTRNSLSFHGTGASYVCGCVATTGRSDEERENNDPSQQYRDFGGTWDGPILAMMDQPKATVIVCAKRRGRGHGGWSKDNPYLEERFVEFPIDIHPLSLTRRLLSVREQIAKEWISDLDILKQANEHILSSYFQLAKEERAKQQQSNQEDTAPSSPTPPTEVFERTAQTILNAQISFVAGASSPFRKGSIDLLYNLCTQASVHRLLRELGSKGSAKEVSFAWLRDFYVERVADYFDGDQPYGRADDFVEALLRTPPSVIYTDDGQVGLADPMGLAEQLIEMRSTVVDEWKIVMENVPKDHAEGIRNEMLNKQMESWGDTSSSSGESTPSTTPEGADSQTFQ